MNQHNIKKQNRTNFLWSRSSSLENVKETYYFFITHTEQK